MSFFKTNKIKVYSVIALAVMLALLVPMVSIGGTSNVFADTVDYYELKVGDESVAMLQTEEEAYDLIAKVRDEYVEEGQNVVDVKMTPAVTVEKVSVPKNEEQPKVEADMANVLSTLLNSDENKTTYVVKDGDTVWDIATQLGMSIDAIRLQNPELDVENIHPGDEITVKDVESFINVIVEYEVESEVIVPFETVYEDDPYKYADEEEIVKTEGEKGKKIITEKVVKVNGIIQSTEEVGSEMIVEPVNKVVIRGTMPREDEGYTELDDEGYDTYEGEYTLDGDYQEASDYTEYEESSESSYEEEYYEEETVSEPSYAAVTYSGDGQSVIDYAMQFVGNPYVWGGTSLTNGCDCSGFVWRVFNDCGYSISRWPDDEFPHVSASELKPGDITRYGTHYAIYIGNGMEISAVNEEQGIRVHPMYYSYSSFWYGIRVIG